MYLYLVKSSIPICKKTFSPSSFPKSCKLPRICTKGPHQKPRYGEVLRVVIVRICEFCYSSKHCDNISASHLHDATTLLSPDDCWLNNSSSPGGKGNHVRCAMSLQHNKSSKERKKESTAADNSAKATARQTCGKNIIHQVQLS